MQNSSNSSNVTDPITGEAMVLDTRYGADALTEGLAEDTSRKDGSAERLTRSIQEKERQFGRVYVNPRTGYRMRVQDDASRDDERGEASQGGGGGRARLREQNAGR
jgi:hypothetical protein